MRLPSALALIAVAVMGSSCKGEPGVARSQEEIDQILQNGGRSVSGAPTLPVGTPAAVQPPRSGPAMPSGMVPPGGR